jgi:hypothetical protein
MYMSQSFRWLFDTWGPLLSQKRNITICNINKAAIFMYYFASYLPVARCLLFAFALDFLSACEYFNNMFR